TRKIVNWFSRSQVCSPNCLSRISKIGLINKGTKGPRALKPTSPIKEIYPSEASSWCKQKNYRGALVLLRPPEFDRTGITKIMTSPAPSLSSYTETTVVVTG
ncbi:hypothetical protein MJO28_006278, partial [Puccinia striiformis f. sp. tritici]